MASTHIVTSLVEIFKSGMFVDMGDLVPHSLGLEEITRSKHKTSGDFQHQ